MRFRLLGLGLAAVLFASLAGSARGYRLEGGRWPSSTITYYNEVPAYAWSVDAAAYAWNSSGARVQLLKSSRSKADVLVGIRWYKVAGDARIERVSGRIVGGKIGVRSGQDRFTMALVLAHEFGHILGLDHEDRVCATMNSSLVVDHTARCPAPPGGSWVCRLLRPDDVRGAISLYGGSVRPWRASDFCRR